MARRGGTADARPRALGYRKPREPAPLEPQAPLEQQYDDWIESLHEQYTWLHERGVMQALDAAKADPADTHGLGAEHAAMRRAFEASLPRRFPGESAAIYRHAAALLADVALGSALAEAAPPGVLPDKA